MDVIARLGSCRVVPVATVEDPGLAAPLGAALMAGGISCLEIAFRHDGAAEALRRAREVDGLLVGAGTVLTTGQARLAAAAGAHFAVAPGTSPEVIACCRELGLPLLPGVATPTEIERAAALGHHILKLFPAAQCGGPGFIRAVAPVYPHVRFVPTGGVTPQNLPDYLALPSVLACGGSWLVGPRLLRARRFDEVERLAREAVLLAA